MDENTFRAPEPEDHDLPGAAAAETEREDNAIPASDYIGQASAMFNFSGSSSATEDAAGEPRTRQAVPPPYSGREAPEPFPFPSAPPSQEGPLPPFITEPPPAEPRTVPSVPPATRQEPVPVPDTELMPEEEKPDGGRSGKKRWVLLACGLALLAAAAGAVLFFLVRGNPFAGSDGRINVPSAMPQTEQEIIDFYRIAVNAVKKDGLAGYRKKTWQSVSTLELTGLELVDRLFGDVFREYVTPESRASSTVYGKDTPEAKAQFPGFTLKDLSYIRSADCVRVGDVYQITIVFQHEDTPFSWV